MQAEKDAANAALLKSQADAKAAEEAREFAMGKYVVEKATADADAKRHIELLKKDAMLHAK